MNFQIKSIFFAKKFGGMKKTPYFCIRNSEMSCSASVAQLVRAPDC